MNKLVKVSLLWGILLWIFGYVLGIVLFPLVPNQLIGWIIMPIGIGVVLWVLLKKVQLDSLSQYIILGIAWLLIAVICDYFLLVKLFKPVDGYYKVDVYIYYALSFILPVIVGWKKMSEK